MKIDMAKVRRKREKAFADARKDNDHIFAYADCEGVWTEEFLTGKPRLMYADLLYDPRLDNDGKE